VSFNDKKPVTSGFLPNPRKRGFEMARSKRTLAPPKLEDNGQAPSALTPPQPATTPEPTPTPPSATPAPTAAPDPFNPATLRLSQEFTAASGVKKTLLTVPVRKPDPSWFVRTHPNPTYYLETVVIELKAERETYLVAQPLWSKLASEPALQLRALFTAINRQGSLFLWPVRLPAGDRRVDLWSQTALDAAHKAKEKWIRVNANMALGAYDLFVAETVQEEPIWPTESFRDLLELAFRNHLIDTLNHPVLRQLRGET
jgi:hypothetical protein